MACIATQVEEIIEKEENDWTSADPHKFELLSVFASTLLRELNKLHKMAIVHGDLSFSQELSENPVFDALSLFKVIPSHVRKIAPESIKEERYSSASDVFQFGLLMISLLTKGMGTWEYGWQDKSSISAGILTAEESLLVLKHYEDSAKYQFADVIYRIPSWCPQAFRDIVLSCVALEPEKRPGTELLLQIMLASANLEKKTTSEKSKQNLVKGGHFGNAWLAVIGDPNSVPEMVKECLNVDWIGLISAEKLTAFRNTVYMSEDKPISATVYLADFKLGSETLMRVILSQIKPSSSLVIHSAFPVVVPTNTYQCKIDTVLRWQNFLEATIVFRMAHNDKYQISALAVDFFRRQLEWTRYCLGENPCPLRFSALASYMIREKAAKKSRVFEEQEFGIKPNSSAKKEIPASYIRGVCQKIAKYPENIFRKQAAIVTVCYDLLQKMEMDICVLEDHILDQPKSRSRAQGKDDSFAKLRKENIVLKEGDIVFSDAMIQVSLGSAEEIKPAVIFSEISEGERTAGEHQIQDKVDDKVKSKKWF